MSEEISPYSPQGLVYGGIDEEAGMNFLSTSNNQFSLQNAKDFADFAEFAATDLAIVQILTMAQHDHAGIDFGSRDDYSPPTSPRTISPFQITPIKLPRAVKSSRAAKPPRAAWKEMYQLLVEYAENHGTCNVPARFTIDKEGSTKRLGRWLADQRKMFQKLKLSPERRDMFHRLIMKGLLDWRPTAKKDKSDLAWDLYYTALLKYSESHVDCNVPRTYTVQVVGSTVSEQNIDLNLTYGNANENSHRTMRVLKLGDWLHKQRTRWTAGLLEDNRVHRLQSLVDRGLLRCDASSETSQSWDKNYRALTDFISLHGSFASEEQIGINSELRVWLEQQRALYRTGELQADCQAKLQLLVDLGQLSWK
jgi:hypothetical protein